MKNKKINQVVEIKHFQDQAKRIVDIKAKSVFLIVWACFVPFIFIMGLPVWVAAMLSSGISGYIYYCGADYMDESVGIWIDKMMAVRIEEEEDRNHDNPHPIKDSSEVSVNVFSSGDDVPMQINITEDQLKDVINIMFYNTYLTQSSINSNH